MEITLANRACDARLLRDDHSISEPRLCPPQMSVGHPSHAPALSCGCCAPRLSFGTLTAQGIREATWVLGFATPSDFVRAYPVSREWLTLLIRRMDAVASVYRLAAIMSPGIDGLRSRVEFHRRGRFDAIITLHDGRSFGVVRQGLALRRRSLYDRLRAIAQYGHGRRPDTVLILVPSAWELRRTARFCINNDLRDCYVSVESRESLERRGDGRRCRR